MSQTIRGPLTVLGRLLLSTIFFMAAVGNKIPHFSEVAKIMDTVGVPAPQFMLVGVLGILFEFLPRIWDHGGRLRSQTRVVVFQKRISKIYLSHFLQLRKSEWERALGLLPATESLSLGVGRFR